MRARLSNVIYHHHITESNGDMETGANMGPLFPHSNLWALNYSKSLQFHTRDRVCVTCIRKSLVFWKSLGTELQTM